MSSREFTEWAAYDKLDPIGGVRGDIQAGIVAATVYNSNRGKGKVLSAKDFMPKFTQAKRPLKDKWLALVSIAKPAKK